MTETELIHRLERLERSHRRLKGFALVALVLTTALATIYATAPVPEKITAHAFDVVDSTGKVRVLMTVDAAMPAIRLYDVDGKPKIQMVVAPYDGLPLIVLSDAQGRESAQISVQQGGAPDIMLFDPTLKGSGFKPSVDIGVDPSGSPSIALADSQGFKMDLGSTSTVNVKTGSTEQTSAASIVMFGNDEKHHVIWQAP